MAKYDNSRVDYLRQAEQLAHFAHSVELESRKGRALGRDVVALVDEVPTKRERRTCFGCGKVGHIEADCRSKARKNHGGRRGRGGGEDLVLAISDSGGKSKLSSHGNKSTDLMYEVEDANDTKDTWILDSGSNRQPCEGREHVI